MNNRIKQIRKESGLTQADFGKVIGVSQNFVWMIETGQREPSDRTIRDICREFNINETWLRTGEGDMKAELSRAEELGALTARLLADRPDKFRSALITTLLRLDPEGREWEIFEQVYNEVAALMNTDENEKSADQ